MSPAGGGWTESLLHNFAGPIGATDGMLPEGPLVLDGEGNLYGTTYAGGGVDTCGGTTGCGVVFEVSPGAGGVWTESIIDNFQGGSHDGARPASGLVLDTAGNLYGTTIQGGSTTACLDFGCGTVFELSQAGGGAWTEKVLHAFSTGEGQNPYSGVVLGSTGNLYGVTAFGGTFGWGMAFELTPASGGTWTESRLHNFGNAKDGQRPATPLVIDSAGNLYGGTTYGGAVVSGECDGSPAGCGAVFQVTP